MFFVLLGVCLMADADSVLLARHICAFGGLTRGSHALTSVCKVALS